ncbi:MAG: glycosyltransferase [Chloroflexia bacterium]|nr:glycosyltransferase [Chloroflexia bacterium]
MPPELAVIVPNLNGGEQLLQTLEAIIASLPTEAEIWMVDDGSSDGSPERVRSRLPQVQVLELGEWRGAASARNQGLRASSSETLFFVDADVTCTPTTLPQLFEALEGADIVFPQIVSPEGYLFSPRTPFARSCCLNSALFGIRRSALARLDDFFDETIQVYGEDNDFFLRAYRLGLRFCYVPTARALHPRRLLLGDKHYYLTVRNAVYVWLKLRGLVPYWMPMDLWLPAFLGAQLLGALCNRSVGSLWQPPPIRYTRGSRLRLLRLFGQALLWNVRHWPATRSQHRKLEAFLRDEHSHFQLA